MTALLIRSLPTFDIRHDGEHVELHCDGQCVYRDKWSEAENLARKLKQAGKQAPPGRTVYLHFRSGPLGVPSEEVGLVGQRLYNACKIAETYTWSLVDPYFTDAPKIRRVLGLPVLVDRAQLERLD